MIEMRERAVWVTHWTEDSVDCLLHGKVPIVQVQPFPSVSNPCHFRQVMPTEALYVPCLTYSSRCSCGKIVAPLALRTADADEMRVCRCGSASQA